MTENDILECPHCGIASKASDLSSGNFFSEGTLSVRSSDAFSQFPTIIKFLDEDVLCLTLECANVACRKSSLWVLYSDGGKKREVRLVPKSSAKPLPDYIPGNLREDYEEACLILEDSPKASAALARRCLQGMIHDFWKVDKHNLYEEIKAIEENIEPDLYNALLGLKDIGNIGSHPELIVDVNKSDAYHLVFLLESLFGLWYVVEHTKKERMSAISQAAQRKKQEKVASRTDGIQTGSLKSPSVENIEQPK